MKTRLCFALVALICMSTSNQIFAFGRGAAGRGSSPGAHGSPANHPGPSASPVRSFAPSVRVAPPAHIETAHRGVAVGPYGGLAAQHNTAGVAMQGGVPGHHSTYYASPNYLANRALAVRGGYPYQSSYFNRGWYGGHPGAWNAVRWTMAGLWAFPTWAALSSYGGYGGQPIYYNYGSNIVYQDDRVYVDGADSASADAFATSALVIADAGRAAKPNDEEWQPLGVFGLVQGEETIANNIFQLAINKSGIIRGNYYDALSDNNQPVYGSVNTTTQRVAWSIGERKDIVYEAGIANLTQGQCPVLIHYGKEKTKQMMLIRLQDQGVQSSIPK